MTIELIEGDCREVLKEFADNSIDSVVTDPPYGLEFMGKNWDAPWRATSGGFSSPGIGNRKTDWPSFKGSNRVRCSTCGLLVGQGGSPCVCTEPRPVSSDAARMQLFQEWCTLWAVDCLRVLKPGGHILAFGGSRTYHRMACAIEDAGFEIRDQIMWLYGSGFPKSSNQEGDWEGWGTALKPAHEPIVVARKPLIGTMAANLARWGVGALNIDGCRVGDEWRSYAPKGTSVNAAMIRVPEHRAGLAGDEVTVQGRWPANVIHDGSDEVLDAFPNASGQMASTSSSRKTQNVYGEMRRGNGRENEPSADSDNDGAVGFKMKPGARRLDSGSAARFFYCAKASRTDRNHGLEDPGPQFQHGTTLRKVENTDTKGNTHPTVKPTDLMRYLVRLVTPPGGTVLDPFMGSGSTGRGAVLEGFSFIGIEMSTEYMDIADARIAAAEAQAAPVMQAAE